MSTLITGAGLIGCQTAAILTAQGRHVVLVDVRPVLSLIETVVPPNINLSIEQCDVSDRAALLAVMQRHGVNEVIHTAAALSSAIRIHPTLAADVNLIGTVNVLEAARILSVKRFVFASSTTVYYSTFGRPQTTAITEDFAFHTVSERPGSLYAASKLASEFFVLHYAQQFDMSVAVLRYSAVLGMWAGPTNSVPGRLMAVLLGQGATNATVLIDDPLLMWSGGEDFIDARDVARANVAALMTNDSPSQVYTIASGRMHRFEDFLKTAKQLRPEFSFVHAPKPASGFAGFEYPREVAFDVTRAQRELDFCAQHDLMSSMQNAMKFV